VSHRLVRRQPADQPEHVVEGVGVLRDQPRPSIRELAGFVGKMIRIPSRESSRISGGADTVTEGNTCLQG
jgi:hypothetical protein